MLLTGRGVRHRHVWASAFIALAGVVVNNNIVLIDTYDRLRDEGWDEGSTRCCRPAASAPARSF